MIKLPIAYRFSTSPPTMAQVNFVLTLSLLHSHQCRKWLAVASRCTPEENEVQCRQSCVRSKCALRSLPLLFCVHQGCIVISSSSLSFLAFPLNRPVRNWTNLAIYWSASLVQSWNAYIQVELSTWKSCVHLAKIKGVSSLLSFWLSVCVTSWLWWGLADPMLPGDYWEKFSVVVMQPAPLISAVGCARACVCVCVCTIP